jgi:uncharacterized membrane protein (UPF0127 family)
MASQRLGLLATLLCCACGPKISGLEELNTRVITLPSGAEIRAEVMIKKDDINRGMMFRDALPQGRGMLFIHEKPSPYRYWMYNVKVPLDIVFMDSSRRIVEISANTPPCTTKAEQCPTYGGHAYEQYVLELRAGEAQRLGLQKGQTLAF